MSHDKIQQNTWWQCPICGETTNHFHGGCLDCERCSDCCACHPTPEDDHRPKRKQGRRAWFLALLLLLPTVGQAQTFDPDWCWTCTDTYEHAAGGALIDFGLQLPIVPKGFRDTVAKRLLVVAVIGAVYEVGQYDVARGQGLSGPGYGIGPKDWLADMAGAVMVELLMAAGRAVFR